MAGANHCRTNRSTFLLLYEGVYISSRFHPYLCSVLCFLSLFISAFIFLADVASVVNNRCQPAQAFSGSRNFYSFFFFFLIFSIANRLVTVYHFFLPQTKIVTPIYYNNGKIEYLNLLVLQFEIIGPENIV